MLSRSSSFTSTSESLNENLKPTIHLVRHHESLQNLPQCPRAPRPMLSRPLNIDHSSQSQHLTGKRPTASNAVLLPTHNLPTQSEKKMDLPIETIKRSIVQDDMENIQERFNEILISANQENESSTHLPAEQSSTTEYFTPKISIDENSKKKRDESINENEEEEDDDEDFPGELSFHSIETLNELNTSFSFDQSSEFDVSSIFRCAFHNIV